MTKLIWINICETLWCILFQIERVLNDIHGNGTTGGHMGEKRTQANIAERFYWRTITEDVKEFVSLHKILVDCTNHT